jgi:alpha-acetolactate decarboxylase
MKNILLLVGLLLIGCQSDQKSIHVNIYGELRQIMHGGVRDGVVALTDVLQDEHVYGLGALEGLEGEILIWDSKPVLTRAKKGGEASFTKSAVNKLTEVQNEIIKETGV